MPPSQQTPPVSTPPPKKLNLAISPKVIIFILLAVIAGMLVLWRPWQARNVNGQTVTVTGESTVTAEPDEFVFTPTYQFSNAVKETALADLTKKSEDMITQLKKLGVTDSQIKTNATSGTSYPYARDSRTGLSTYTFRPTLTINSKELAQKVQDYLVTTSPTGSVSPAANFSDAKQKELENKARDEATKEARTKAEQSAKNLGFKLGKVQSVNDGQGFGGYYGVDGGAEALVAEDSTRKLTVQPGENKLKYSVSVAYFVN